MRAQTMPLILFVILSCSPLSLAAAENASASLRAAVSFHASFDNGVDADIARGDKRLYSAPQMAFPPKAQVGLPETKVVSLAKGEGVSGDCLHFQKKVPDMVFYYAKGNMPYEQTNWSGSVSFWLRLSPDEDLEPGYCDPIQITSKAWNNAAFFVEFSKEEKPREFRLAAYPDFKVWNPQNRNWDSIPFVEKPLAPVIKPPFERGRWTHVLFTFENFNTGKPDGVAKLYLNGNQRAMLPARQQTFTWDLDKTLVMLGLSYIGYYDELAIFNRVLTEIEIQRVYEAKYLKKLLQ